MNRLLRNAILLLRNGYPLPVDVATNLMAEGIDVAALEAKYSL